MEIRGNVLRHYLRNCYFIDGTAYAGKSTMANFKACLARLNSPETYDAYLNSGFFTIIREDLETDRREENLAKLATHFGFVSDAPVIK